MKNVQGVMRVNINRRRHVLFTLISFTILVFVLEIFNFVTKANAKQIVISENNMSLTYETSQKDVESFLRDNNIELGEFDKVNVSMNETLSDGMIIEIKRAIPIILKLNGKNTTVYSSDDNVGEFLKSQGIRLTPTDDLSLLPETKLESELLVEVNIYDTKEQVTEEDVPYQTRYEATTKLPKGVTELKTKGIKGRKKVTYSVKVLDGEEVTKVKIDEEIIKAPVDEVILQGTVQTVKTASGKVYNTQKTLYMTTTGYDNCYKCTHKNPGDPGYGVTASGMKTAHGIVAVDTRVIPLGTRLYIEGYGEAIAADTGSAVKGNHIDLYFDTHENAKMYGTHRNVPVYILSK